MSIIKLSSFSLLFIVIVTASAQHDEEPDLNFIIETIFSMQDETLNYDDVFESYTHLYHHPIDLNNAEKSDLLAMYVLDEQEVARILSHRKKFGEFLSIFELYLIEGVDSLKINLIKPFITVSSYNINRYDTVSFIKRFRKYSRSSLIIRYSRIIERRRGYVNRQIPAEVLKNQYYAGSPDQIYARFQLQIPGDLNIGVTVEKDAGEPISFVPSAKLFGFDHYSGYVQKHYNSWLKHITLGNFQYHAGQGLVMGKAFTTGKGTESIATLKRYDQGLRPYQGAMEFGYFQGIAVGVGGVNWSFDTFLSSKNEDAMIKFEKDIGRDVISGFIQNGYHRTPLELERKNSATVRSVGFRGKYQSKYRNLIIGVSGIWNQFNLPVLENQNYYNRFDISGMDHNNLGLYYDYFKGKINVFGEVARSKSGGIGFISGIIANLSSEIETIIHIRYYSKQYFSLFSKSFGEFSVNNNEQGIYLGLKFKPFTRVQMHFFFDIFRSLWLRYLTASPSVGREWMFYLRYYIEKYSALDIYFREEYKDYNMSLGVSKEYSVSEGLRRKARISYRYKPETGLTLMTRLQGDHFLVGNRITKGFAVVQDMGYRFSWGYLKGRICYFNTDDYHSRLFVYEDDVLYYYSMPAYFGHGIRYYLLFKIILLRNLNFWFKIGQYNLFDQNTIGSGLDQINGNKKTDLRFQIQLKF